WKIGAVRGLLRGDGARSGLRLRRSSAEIAADMAQAIRLDRRADVVEDNGFQRRRLHGADEMDDQPAARRADEGGLGDAERGEPGQYVAGLRRDIIIADVGVVLGLPPAAIVEGDHLA